MNLRLRLLLANFLVLSLGLGCAAIVGHNYKAQRFPSGLSKLQKQHTQQVDLRAETLDLFQVVNSQGTLLALACSFLTVGTLTFWLVRSILLPLKKIEQTAEQFSAGDLSARILPGRIPEIRHLELTLNSVADRLQGVEERRRELIGDLTHEIATPLTVIRGYLELLHTSTFELTPSMRQQLYEEAERLARLMNDLKLLSSVEAGSLPLRLQPFLPLPAIRWVITSFQLKGWHTNCHLELDCPNALSKVFADLDRFKQVLTNLVSNALAYTLEGTVTVRAWAGGNFLHVQVQDTGIGIASEELPFLFDRFWRSKHSRHLRLDGSGIGLAITKRLVEAMNGQIEVDTQLGMGTTFRVFLPLDAPTRLRSSLTAITQISKLLKR